MRKHNCPHCTCTITTRADNFDPEATTWVRQTLIPTPDAPRLYTSQVFSAYVNWCHKARGINPLLTQPQLTRLIRALGYTFHPGGSSQLSLTGYRLAS
jgi:hypothetical protein